MFIVRLMLSVELGTDSEYVSFATEKLGVSCLELGVIFVRPSLCLAPLILLTVSV